MGLEKVVEEILKRGEDKRKEIISTGEKERDDQIRAAQKRIEESRMKADARTKSAIAQMEQQELSSAELESKREILESEKQVMEELKEQVLEELEKYPEDRKRKLYSKLIDNAKKELGPCGVYANRKDSALLKLPSGMTYAGQIETRGGLVFESKDGTVRLDYRFESMIDDVWNEKMRDIYKKLFG